MNKLSMTSSVFHQIKNSIGSVTAEKGGMLGTSSEGVIDHFYYDRYARTNSVEFNPNVKTLNKVLENDWFPNGIYFAGIIHSHPSTFMKPSYADIQMAKDTIEALGLDYFYMPIVRSGADGHFAIYSYVVEIVDRRYVVREIDLFIDGSPYRPDVHTVPNPFDRIKDIIDIPMMKQSVIIGVGVGGSRDYYVNMARLGVGHFVLIDGDKIETHNVASQGVYGDEVGQFKTDAAKTQLNKLNKDIRVQSIHRYFDDKFTDDEFESILHSYRHKKQIILAAFTDNFHVQARLSRLALHYELPYVAGQHFEDGIGSEVLYWFPHVSTYCPRCLLNSRYDAYLKNNYRNHVKSNHSPAFVTTRLNALCEKITLGMMMYHEHQDSVYCGFMTNHPTQNYAMIRHAENLPELINIPHKFMNNNYFMDDVVWFDGDELTPENYQCEDCHREEHGHPTAKKQRETFVEKEGKTMLLDENITLECDWGDIPLDNDEYDYFEYDQLTKGE